MVALCCVAAFERLVQYVVYVPPLKSLEHLLTLMLEGLTVREELEVVHVLLLILHP